MDNDLRVGFAEFADDEEGISLEVGVVLPILTLGVLAGVICAEGDDGEVRFEGEGLFEMGSIYKGSVGFSKHAEASGGEGLDVVVFAEELTQAAGVAVEFTFLNA